MSSIGSLTLCVQHLRSPDCRERDEAARVIWERFSSRLQALVRRHLDNRIRRREDEQDILRACTPASASASSKARRRRPVARSCGSSWCGSRCARSSTPPTGTWRPAATFAASGRRPRRLEHSGSLFPALDARTRRQRPAQPRGKGHRSRGARAAAPGLSEELRQIVLWKLDGFTNAEIASMIGRTVRCVELKMQLIRKRLELKADSSRRWRASGDRRAAAVRRRERFYAGSARGSKSPRPPPR